MKAKRPTRSPRKCPTSGKVAHRSPNSAAAHLLSLQRSKAWDGHERHVYPCPNHRGEWLIGRVPTNTRAA